MGIGLKNRFPEMAFSGYKVTPEENDRYEVYSITNPTTSPTWVGTFPVAGTAATGTLVFVNAIAGYPRNVEFALAGTGAGMAGTLTLYGTNQFGGSINEVFGFTAVNNGGTVVGTRVFAHFSAGTLNFGTAVGNGTARVGVGTTGTTCIFGLPAKIGGTTDVKLMSSSANHLPVTIGGGTIAAFVDSVQHAIKAPVSPAGTAFSLSVWYKPTYDANRPTETATQMANMGQRV